MTERIRHLIELEIADRDLKNPFIVECEFFKEYARKFNGFFVTAIDSHNRTWVYFFVFNGNIDEDNNMYIEQIFPIV